MALVMRALGLMSGTSMDGVDAAVLETDGEVIHDFGPSSFLPCPPQKREVLRSGLGLWPGDDGLPEMCSARVAVRASSALHDQGDWDGPFAPFTHIICWSSDIADGAAEAMDVRVIELSSDLLITARSMTIPRARKHSARENAFASAGSWSARLE